jgi:hypothetical protein
MGVCHYEGKFCSGCWWAEFTHPLDGELVPKVYFEEVDTMSEIKFEITSYCAKM